MVVVFNPEPISVILDSENQYNLTEAKHVCSYGDWYAYACSDNELHVVTDDNRQFNSAEKILALDMFEQTVFVICPSNIWMIKGCTVEGIYSGTVYCDWIITVFDNRKDMVTITMDRYIYTYHNNRVHVGKVIVPEDVAYTTRGDLSWIDTSGKLHKPGKVKQMRMNRIGNVVIYDEKYIAFNGRAIKMLEKCDASHIISAEVRGSCYILQYRNKKILFDGLIYITVPNNYSLYPSSR